MLQQVAVALERHDAQVDLDAVVRDDRGLGVAAAEHLGHGRQLDEPGGQRRAVGRRRRSGRCRRRSRRGAAASPPRRRARRPGARAAARARCARARAPGRAGTRACAARRPPRAGPGAAAPCARRSPPGPCRRPSRAAASRSSSVVMPSSCQSLRVVLAPRPGRRMISTRPRAPGRQLLERRHRAGLAQLADLRRDRVADVVELGQAALLREAPDRLGGLAEALGRLAVGEHAVDDGAVQLVEVAEQVEEVGDLGVAQGSHRRRGSYLPLHGAPGSRRE